MPNILLFILYEKVKLLLSEALWQRYGCLTVDRILIRYNESFPEKPPKHTLSDCHI